MAPAAANTPGRKKRDRGNNFFDVGVQGRKTGLTLKDTGERDEFGMMPIEGIFSSPEKSPTKDTMSPEKGDADRTLTSEVDMDIQQSSMPDPIETLSARRLTRSAKTMIPPPIGRSPQKTFLGSSPRRSRSMGPQSIIKPAMRPPTTPSRASPGLSVKRRLNFTKDDPLPSTEKSPMKVRQSIEKPRAERSSVESRKRSHDQSVEEDNSLPNAINGHEDVLQDSFPDVYDNQATFDDDPIFNDDGDSIQAVEIGQQEQAEPPPKRKRGRPRKSDEENAAPDAGGSFVARLSWSAKKGLEQNTDKTPGGGVPARLIDPSILGAESPSTNAKKQMRTRPSSNTLSNGASDFVDGIDEPSDADEEPQPRRRVPVHREMNSVDAVPQKGRKGRKPGSKAKAPVERDPNARLASVVSTQDEDGEGSDAAVKQPERNRRARSLQVLRQGTPLDEPGTRKTRYGRTSVKPVDWWRGERVDRQWDGTIENVIRADDVALPKRTQKRRAAAAKRGMSALPEEEEEREDWEMDPGILTGFVSTWDEEAATSIEDEEREEQLAFAANMLETRDVAGSNFRYTKCLNLPFFGSGLVDLPPGGFKRLKNSRRMQMIFFVHAGKVVVQVADTEFSISKGGVWQVPRGNTYSIENHSDKPARIFFAQGCLSTLEEMGQLE